MEGSRINIKTAFFEHFLPILIGILLVVCGFLAGWYWKNATSQPGISVTLAPEQTLVNGKSEKPTEPLLAQKAEPKADCAFVASKKGTKYHSGSSRVAKQIKPENLLCFEDKAGAEKEGLAPGVME
jgi:hypothetical protein